MAIAVVDLARLLMSLGCCSTRRRMGLTSYEVGHGGADVADDECDDGQGGVP